MNASSSETRPSAAPRSRFERFLVELKRRRVLRVVVGYVVIAFGFLEGYQLVYPTLGLPDWTYDGLVFLVVLGLPAVAVLSWVYDLKLSGLTRTGPLNAQWPSTADSADEASRSGAEVESGSIAVLPFADMSQEHDQEYFAEGIAEEIIHALARVDGLKVAARTSSFAYGARPQDVRAIGAELSVANVLEGSVRKSGGRVRITTQLIEASTGYHLWSETFERERADIFAIQDEIRDAVLETVAPRLRGRGPTGAAPTAHTPRPEAYEAYLRGRHHWYKRFRVGLMTAVESFQKAIELDPDYAPPYAGVADAMNSLGIFGFMPPAAARAKAVPMIERALALDPHLARAYFSRGCFRLFYDWDFEAAERDLATAVELDPTYAEAVAWQAFAPTLRGRPEAGVERANEAVRLDPDSPYLGVLTGLTHTWVGDRDRAIATEEWVLAQDPTVSTALFLLGDLKAAGGQPEEGVRLLERSVEATNRAASWVCGLASAYARAGRTEEAMTIRQEALRRGEQEYVSPTALAMLEAHTGSADATFAALDAAVDERSPLLMLSALLPVFDAVRADPRFAAVLRRMGITVTASMISVPGSGADPS